VSVKICFFNPYAGFITVLYFRLHLSVRLRLMVRLKALVFPTSGCKGRNSERLLRRKTYLVIPFLILTWLFVMPILGLQSSSLNISSQGMIKYPRRELGVWNVGRGTAVPEGASWIVATCADYGKPNQLTNPGFELEFLGWRLTAHGLNVSFPTGYVGKSLLLTSNVLGYQGGVFQYFPDIPPNTTFHFKAMVKTVDVESLKAVILYRDVYDAEKNWYGGHLTVIQGSSDWTLYETSFTTPDKITDVYVYPALVNNRGDVQIDETSLIIEGWQPPRIPVILNWYAFRPSLPIRTQEALTELEQGLKSITTDNFWGIISPVCEEIYRTHIDFNDDVDTTWFGERLLGYPKYLEENPGATQRAWQEEMYLRMIRGFYNYFSPLTKVGITWGIVNFIKQHYDFLILYPYTENLEYWLQQSKPYLSAVEEQFLKQKKFWILTRIWDYNKENWEREAIALEMKNCLDRNIVIMPYSSTLEEVWPLMLKAIQLYNSQVTYFENYIYGKNLLTDYIGKTYGWVQVSE